MKKEFLRNIIKESITDYLSELNSITEEVTPMQQYLIDYESEISDSPEQYFDDIKKLNSINDVIGYYGGKRQWTADKDLKQELSNLIKTLKSKFPISEGLIDETPITEEKTPFEDKVTKDQYVYLVKKAMNESTEKDLIEKKLLLDLIGEGLYEGAYLNEAAAMNAAKKVLKGRDVLMKENVKKGQSKVGDLEKQVVDLKSQMQKLIDNPEMRNELSSYTAKLEKTEQVLTKLKSALEKSAPKKEKKETKDDK